MFIYFMLSNLPCKQCNLIMLPNILLLLQKIAFIKHAILAQRAVPVAPHIINRWVVSRSVSEVDFSPDVEEPSSSAVISTMPPASVPAIINVEPLTGRVLGSHWKVSGDIKQPIKVVCQCRRLNIEVQCRSSYSTGL